MPRPKKAGLEYYYKGVHDWDDIEMTELMQKYGPLGCCIYEVVLSKVYESGYYLEISLDRLAGYVVKVVGNRWIRDKSIALQVIRYCAEIGLFDHALLQQSVVTSAKIQQHYAEVTARSKADKSKYWLLGESKKRKRRAAQPSLPAEDESAVKTEVFAAKTPEKTANIPQSKVKQTKENKTKANQSKAEESKAAQTTAASPPPNKVEEAFASVAGRPFRQSDIAALKEMQSAGADEGMIVGIIREVASRGNTEITSMWYFLPIVREALQKKKDFPLSSWDKRKSERLPETFETDDVESILDEEWLAEISKYPPMREEDYV